MADNYDKEDVYEKLLMELRRGVLVLAVLSQADRPQYGYSLKQALSDSGLDIQEGTLYPLLRRLEAQGLLISEWQVVDDTRPRRYYQLSPAGAVILSQLTQEWNQLTAVMNHLLSPNRGDEQWKQKN